MILAPREREAGLEIEEMQLRSVEGHPHVLPHADPRRRREASDDTGSTSLRFRRQMLK